MGNLAVNFTSAFLANKPQTVKDGNQTKPTKGQALLKFADDICEKILEPRLGENYQSIKKLRALDMNFEVIEDAKWQELIKSGDFNAIDKAYKQAFKELGTSFIQAVDERGGDGNGVLTYKEFVNSKIVEGDDLELQGIFKHLDVNGDEQIDNKEMAAFLRLTDNSIHPEKDQADNAKIDAYSMYIRLANLYKERNKTNMELAYEDLFGKIK